MAAAKGAPYQTVLSQENSLEWEGRLHDDDLPPCAQPGRAGRAEPSGRASGVWGETGATVMREGQRGGGWLLENLTGHLIVGRLAGCETPLAALGQGEAEQAAARHWLFECPAEQHGLV